MGVINYMKFSQRISVRKNVSPIEMGRGIWTPKMRSWRDVIEDYLYISRKRINNKWSIFKLQLNILQDIVNNIKSIDDCKNLEIANTKDEKAGKITKEAFEIQAEHTKDEIYSDTIINKALREIVDGIVWKYFNYNRAILYMLADKQPIETIRPDQGTLNNLYEFGDEFLEKDAVAIYNDITNFLRIGDVTKIKIDNSIEIIEVKAGKKRGARITRQRDKMAEIVEFFNTGLTNYDGVKLKILDSSLKQNNYLSQLYDAIKSAKYRGFESLLIGNYIILQIADYSKIKDESFISFFESKHRTVRDAWKRNNDFIIKSFFLDKMEYSKNCAPFSIYPFDVETCTDIMTGQLMILSIFNFSEVLRIVKKAGWDIVDSIIFKSEDEFDSIKNMDPRDISYLKVGKGKMVYEVPPSLIARMQFELLSPNTMIQHFEEFHKMGPQKEFDFFLTNFIDDQRIWQ
jgi:hypothetical protein